MEFTYKWKGAILSQEERNQRLHNLMLSNPELAKLFETAIMEETYEAFRNEDDPNGGSTSLPA